MKQPVNLMKIVFDTNVFRDVQRGTISNADMARADERLKRELGFVSPLSLIELGSHICEEERTRFDLYHQAIQAARRLCRQALPDPEVTLRERVFGAPRDENRGLSPTETMEILRLISMASSYEDLVQGQITQWQGAHARVSYKSEYLKKFREDYESKYIEDMHEHVLEVVCPDWKHKRSQGKMANLEDPDLRKHLVDYLGSDEFRRQFFWLQAERAGVHLIGESMWDKAAFERLAPFFDAYHWILQAMINSGYNPQKNKNDFNDIHFLLYLSDPDMILVSSDGGIARKASSTRVMTFTSWLAS